MKIECVQTGFKSISILIDGEPWRDIHITLFGKNPDLPKECFSIEEFAQKFSLIELRQAKMYALKRLSMASLASGKLFQNFRRLLVSEEAAQLVIEYLSKAGYLNDADFAAGFVRSQSARKMGPRAIACKLARQGFSYEEADAAIEVCQSAEQQKEAIVSLLASRFRSRNLSDLKQRKKVIGALARRGFELSIILESLHNS